MGLFDGLQDLVQNLTGGAEETLTNAKESVPIEEVSGTVEEATNSVNDVKDQATGTVEAIKNSLGL